MTPRIVMGIMIISLLGIFVSAEVSSVEDGLDTPPESLLAKSTIVPTEEMMTGAPAPPPPDPAALAMAMAMKEKAEKGKEKTAKKMHESARKSKKRAAWRQRQAAKLAKIKNEANAKIKKEAMHKKKLLDFQHKKENQEKAKKKKIRAKVKKLKAASMIKIKELRAKNKLTKTRMNAKMALLKKTSKEKNTKLTAKVKAEIGIQQKKAAAKRTLVLAKITSETAKKKAAANKALAAGEKAIQDHYAKIALDHQKEAQTKKTFKGLLAAKTAKHKAALAKRNQKAAQKRARQVAKERQEKSRIRAAFNKKIALARAGHFPGGARVLRVARRKKKLVRLLKREATRRARAHVLASKKKFEKMMRKSQKSLNQVARAELHVMRKASKGDDTASNMAVTDAWSLAMGQKPTKPQAEALQLVKEEHDTPSTDLLAAWKMAVGKHLPNAPTGPKPNPRTVQAFAEALNTDKKPENARASIHVAWEAAAGHAPRGTAAAVAQALHFTPDSTAPPPQAGSNGAVAASDEVDASLAAGTFAKVIPAGAPVLRSAGASIAHGDPDPEDAAKAAMESVLVKAHEIAKPMVAEGVKHKHKASHSAKNVQPSVAMEAKATKATHTKHADTKSGLHIEPAGTAKKHVPKTKRSAAIMAKLKELEGVRARIMLKKKRTHKAMATVVGTATSLDLDAVKAAPSLKKKPSDLVEEGAGAGTSGKPIHSTKHSGVATIKAQGFGVAVALIAAGAMLYR